MERKTAIDRLEGKTPSLYLFREILEKAGVDTRGLNRHFIIDELARLMVEEMPSMRKQGRKLVLNRRK